MKKGKKVFVLASAMMFLGYGINSVKAQECSAILDTEVSNSPKFRAVSPTLPESSAAVNVDVLVVYTPAAKEWAEQNGYNIDDLIDIAMQRSNLVLSNSQTGVTLNLAHKQEIDYVESNDPNTDLAYLRNPQDGYADEAHALRSQYNADLVMLLLGDAATNNVLGAGYIPRDEWGNAKAAFSVAQVKTLPSGYTFIHELGHNFGCGHHTDVDNTALYSYAHGYRGITNLSTKFSTIMTYETTTGVYYPHIPYFSDENIEFEGVKIGSAAANNAKTIRQFKSVAAKYSDEVKQIDAFLQTINVSEGTLSPAFNAGIYNYEIKVDNSVQSIDIEGITNSPLATVLNGNAADYQLSVGDNLIEIKVTDNWRNYEKTYTLNIIREEAGAGITTGVDEIDGNLIEIYPNHVNDKLRIINYELKGNETIQIIDIAGKIIHNSSFIINNSIDVSNLLNGVYILKIKTGKGTTTKKIIKK